MRNLAGNRVEGPSRASGRVLSGCFGEEWGGKPSSFCTKKGRFDKGQKRGDYIGREGI